MIARPAFCQSIKRLFERWGPKDLLRVDERLYLAHLPP